MGAPVSHTPVQVEEDFHDWLLEQASALRERRFKNLDCDSLAEELEAMGARERRELKSQLKKLLLHLLKFQAQSAALPRHHSWRSSIREARDDIADILRDSPGIFQGKRDEFIATAFARARRQAIDETSLPPTKFPEHCPWSFEQIIDDDYFPPRRKRGKLRAARDCLQPCYNCRFSAECKSTRFRLYVDKMRSFLEIQWMFSRAKLLCLMVVLAAPVAGCNRKVAHFDPALAKTFFPLTPHAVWSYRVNSKSQRTTYVVTDKSLGVEYVPSLNVTGQVVEEYYNMDRGGSRPIVYVTKNGYLTRLSGLEYNKDEISAPAWGRSEEGEFMPALMEPDVSWKSTVFPFGHMEGAFDIKQSHRTVFETQDVVVPAGRFTGCVRIDTLANYEGGAFAKSHKDNRLLYQDWYAPHIGLVKTEVREKDANGPRMELVELLRFTPPPSGNVAGATTH